MKKVLVIIVTYNGMKWIEECLKSVLSSSISVIPLIIDNNSTDETVNYITANFPDVILFKQSDNLGFGKANNIGMSYAIKQKADFVFLLNQDAFVDKNTIKKLIEVSLNNPEYGILSPIQLDYSGKRLENYFFRFMANDKSRTFYSDFVLKNELKNIYEIDFIQAAAWLLPIHTIKNIGGFDPLFFHYGEDNNYCQRVIFHGLKIGVVPNAFVRHDATIHDMEYPDLFTEKYFKIYEKKMCEVYANLNITFDEFFIQKERKNIYRSIVLSFIKLNLKKSKVFHKKLVIYNNLVKIIKASRENNIKINTHYLDV
jgi:GT2 family glycosyltransferase